MPDNNITEQPMSDKTGRKLIEALEKATIYPETRLSIANGALCITFTVKQYDPTKDDGYEIGEYCYILDNSEIVYKRCIEDTPKPAGLYDQDCWVTQTF